MTLDHRPQAIHPLLTGPGIVGPQLYRIAGGAGDGERPGVLVTRVHHCAGQLNLAPGSTGQDVGRGRDVVAHRRRVAQVVAQRSCLGVHRKPTVLPSCKVDAAIREAVLAGILWDGELEGAAPKVKVCSPFITLVYLLS